MEKEQRVSEEMEVIDEELKVTQNPENADFIEIDHSRLTFVHHSNHFKVIPYSELHQKAF